MESKRVSISAKRQITIPQKFFTALGFGSEAECSVKGDALIIRPARENGGGEFAEQILADLIAQGYEGTELLEQFKHKQSQVRPAVKKMLEDAQKVAEDASEYATYRDVFGEDKT